MQVKSAIHVDGLDRPPNDFFKILIVDDEMVVRKLLHAMLSEDGYKEIDEAESGEEALDALKKKDYHLILLDKNLPGIDGIEVLKQIKKTRSKIEVIIITGYASLETAVTAMELGAFGYISKPFSDIQTVMSRIKGALDRATVRYHIGTLHYRLERLQDLLKKAEAELSREAMAGNIRDASGRLRIITNALKNLA